MNGRRFSLAYLFFVTLWACYGLAPRAAFSASTDAVSKAHNICRSMTEGCSRVFCEPLDERQISLVLSVFKQINHKADQLVTELYQLKEIEGNAKREIAELEQEIGRIKDVNNDLPWLAALTEWQTGSLEGDVKSLQKKLSDAKRTAQSITVGRNSSLDQEIENLSLYLRGFRALVDFLSFHKQVPAQGFAIASRQDVERLSAAAQRNEVVYLTALMLASNLSFEFVYDVSLETMPASESNLKAALKFSPDHTAEFLLTSTVENADLSPQMGAVLERLEDIASRVPDEVNRIAISKTNPALINITFEPKADESLIAGFAHTALFETRSALEAKSKKIYLRPVRPN